jgi:AraC-like DNA-binding protein
VDPLLLTGSDPLTDLLNGVRSTGAVFNRSARSGSWAVRFEDGSPLALAVPLRGPVWVIPHGGEAVQFGPGDVAVLCGGRPYVIADDPATEVGAVIGSGARCTTIDGEQTITTHGVGTWGTPEPDSTLLFNGLYTVDGGIPARLLATLPPLALVDAGSGSCPIHPDAFEQVTRPGPGQQVLLDRMLDLMLLCALRSWFIRPGAQVPAWYRAHGDPVVGTALRLLEADLARPWTVEALARGAGVSRAALARRFTSLVGQPPMTYLRERRLALAADLLLEPEATLGAVAGQVGFSTAFALSLSFKREHGISPSQYRTRATHHGLPADK